jgi:hypothetical protein
MSLLIVGAAAVVGACVPVAIQSKKIDKLFDQRMRAELRVVEACILAYGSELDAQALVQAYEMALEIPGRPKSMIFDILYASVMNGDTGLFEACLKLAQRERIDMVCQEGRKLLSVATNGPSLPILGKLLPLVDANARDDAGRTALMWAALYGNRDSVEVLLPFSDVAIRDNNGQTARELAWISGNRQAYGAIASFELMLREKRLLDLKEPLCAKSPPSSSIRL